MNFQTEIHFIEENFKKEIPQNAVFAALHQEAILANYRNKGIMEKKYTTYCGLYCGNCAVKARLVPAAKNLHEEMINAGFADVMQYIPDGEGFWKLLRTLAENTFCVSCREGGGNPGCRIRKCAQEKGIEMCAFCKEYPCGLFDDFKEGYPGLMQDNILLRDKGIGIWGAMQDERRNRDYTYTDEKKAP